MSGESNYTTKRFHWELSDENIIAWAHNVGTSGREVTKIDLSYCRNITDAAITALAANCANLTTINLNSCYKIDQVTDASVTALATHCPNLTEVDLGGCNKVTDAAITTLATHCPKLTTVNLGGCDKVTDTAVQALAAHCPNLTTIDLSGCDEVRDSSIICIARFCKQLEYIQLGECWYITDNALMELGRCCMGLTGIDLDKHGDGITWKMVKKLMLICEHNWIVKKARPKIAALRIHRFWRDVCYNPVYKHAQNKLLVMLGNS